ncbi:MBL fold metallo-hydrolase [Chloroflexota bacterium]
MEEGLQENIVRESVEGHYCTRIDESIMEIKITTLSENTANYGYLAEWGLSILIEVDESTILMDTGFSFSAVHNAQLMGIDLSKIDCIVLSHGHVDHTSGLRDVLKIRREVKIVAHPDIWIPKYVRRDGERREQHNGMPFTSEDLESHCARFNLVREPVYIAEHILTTGEIPMLLDYEEIENNLFVKEAGMLRPDPLADDMALIIDTDFGLVVILGCAHRGMINTLRHAQNLTGKELVYAVIGGTHLFRASEERMERTIADLKETGVQRIGVSHCTGFRASARLAREFEDMFFLNNAGTRLTLP